MLTMYINPMPRLALRIIRRALGPDNMLFIKIFDSPLYRVLFYIQKSFK